MAYFVLIELCRIEISRASTSWRDSSVLIELCRIEMTPADAIKAADSVLIELCRIEMQVDIEATGFIEPF